MITIMDRQSDFQRENPLSSRKFWKKIFEKVLQIVAFFVIGLIYVNFAEDAQLREESFLVIKFGVIAVMLIGAIYAIYVRVYIARYYYNCDGAFITIKKGVFAPTEIHVQYQKIQDVYVDQDIIDRIMGLYDVHIASATITSGIEAHIDGVEFDAAERIKNFLLGKIQGGNSVPSAPSSNAKPNMDQKISSKNYPISRAWIVVDAINFLMICIVPILVIAGAVGALSLISVIRDGFRGLLIGGLLVYAGIAFALLVAVLYVVRLVWVLFWLRNYYFEFLPDDIVIKTGVIARQETHLPYKSIQNVRVVERFMDRIFGLGIVAIENAAAPTVIGYGRHRTFRPAGISLIGQPITKAREIAAALNKMVSGTDSSKMGL